MKKKSSRKQKVPEGRKALLEEEKQNGKAGNVVVEVNGSEKRTKTEDKTMTDSMVQQNGFGKVTNNKVSDQKVQIGFTNL